MKRTKTSRNCNANETKNKHICYPSPVSQTVTDMDCNSEYRRVTENTRLKEKTGSKKNQSVDK